MFNPREERDFKVLRRLSQKLGVPMPEAFLELEVTKDGRVLTRIKQRSHSWTRNGYNLMMSQLNCLALIDAAFEAGKINVKDTGGVVKTSALRGVSVADPDGDWIAAGQGLRGGAASNTMGVVVGSGENAESFEDFALQTIIAEGAGGGQLNHVAGAAVAITWNGGTKIFETAYIRYFNNNSGGNVLINEVGLIDACRHSSAFYNILLSRDKLASTVTVPDTGQLKVTYTIQLTYPV